MDIVAILKEHFSDLMTEDIEKKITDSFELIVSEKVSEKKDEMKTALDEEYETKLESKVIEIEERLNTYINKANEEFIQENLKSVESESKVQLATNIFEGVIKTLKENNMDIAIEQKDIVSQLEIENKKLEASLNESMKSIEEAKEQELEYKKAITISEMCTNLTETQKEKVMKMTEGVKVSDVETFKEKVTSAIEMITEKKEPKKDDDDFINESFDVKKPEPKVTDVYVPKWFK